MTWSRESSFLGRVSNILLLQMSYILHVTLTPSSMEDQWELFPMLVKPAIHLFLVFTVDIEEDSEQYYKS